MIRLTKDVLVSTQINYNSSAFTYNSYFITKLKHFLINYKAIKIAAASAFVSFLRNLM